MELNQIAQEMIATFAKSNKVSKVKVTDLVQQVLGTVEIPQVEKKSSGKPRGRTASEETVALRENIKAKLLEVKQTTAKELSKEFQVSPVDANNVLKFLEKQGAAVRAGLKDKDAGVRGKREIIWAFAATE